MWLWWTRQPGLPPVPIGVYDHPPPADTHIFSLQLSDLPGTSVYLGNKMAELLTRIQTYLGHLLPA